ncbi:MAG TPA: hypothetical protein EYN07_08680 [Flavobacteriaceae bacterium]|jgi:hypothetical protein|nr:hypothetical protein [Flavobacteriaceae bacterium]MAM30585.1 hypothetical protein [Flavobacteriaceae bacterium]MAY52162.1 hypothetical protein [Flavobacteriaceae bacterium]HBR55846.1 hypothetical protein [Flavobacteriaceae bacterium]HIB47142.1 hypothetical protein [Flavobacteriaceae bacterium]|tara:strand:+ start:940 stop:1137 length:198 start_codon:yes stop_codon:yes gene_type:complete
MKIVSYILIALALGLLIFNATKIDFDAPFEGDSTVAVICVLAAACVIVLLLILRTSLTIQQKSKR